MISKTPILIKRLSRVCGILLVVLALAMLAGVASGPAEPFILGVSGGAAIGAIIGIMFGLSYFPGVSTTAFLGSSGTLALILFLTAGQSVVKKESLLLSGVMVNAFCSAVIMFLISVTQDTRLVFGRQSTGGAPGVDAGALFRLIVLAFSHHESVIDGQRNGPNHGG